MSKRTSKDVVASVRSRLLNDEFAERSEKIAQWSAFIKKGLIADTPGGFVNVMADIRMFLLPVARAGENKELFKGRWPEGGPWRK